MSFQKRGADQAPHFLIPMTKEKKKQSRRKRCQHKLSPREGCTGATLHGFGPPSAEGNVTARLLIDECRGGYGSRARGR
jgi:hypothetical protein